MTGGPFIYVALCYLFHNLLLSFQLAGLVLCVLFILLLASEVFDFSETMAMSVQFQRNTAA